MQNMTLITISDSVERDLLLDSLRIRYALTSEALIISPEGAIKPNPRWWRKAGLTRKTYAVEVAGHCKGWIDGRAAVGNARYMEWLNAPETVAARRKGLNPQFTATN
jgi:hypothetical protein